MSLSSDKYSQKSTESVAAMTLKEKVALMSGRGLNKLVLPIHALFFRHYNKAPYHNADVKRLGIPSVKFCDGPRGVVSQCSSLIGGKPLGGSVFDRLIQSQ